MIAVTFRVDTVTMPKDGREAALVAFYGVSSPDPMWIGVVDENPVRTAENEDGG